jgi:hypothetical protein
MLTQPLGTWSFAGNNCTATLDFDWGRSVNISLRWSREPGPTEHEHLALILPDIVGAALDAVWVGAATCETVLELIADGRVCRSGIKDGLFEYEALGQNPPGAALHGKENA